ncbi:MAG TPA: hypothetical protein PK514_12845 [Spirochaetota bacterium]|nr:hypothetical protein [Spirochaetota bacterium]
MFKRTFLILNILALVAIPGLSQKSGGIDWTGEIITAAGTDRITVNDEGLPFDPDTGRIISISEARNMSYTRAKEKAINAAALLISEIPVDNDSTIMQIIERDPVARARMTRVMHEYSKFRDRPAGYMETTCELKLKAGYLITAMNYDFPMEEFPESDQKASPTLYTSLIVDVRGLDIRPMLLPSIYNENGLEIYGKNFISGDDAVKHLSVSYAYSESDAKKHKKAGQHPFFCAALKNLNGSPVLSDDDIKRLFSHKKNSAYIKKCRVIFIIDR